MKNNKEKVRSKQSRPDGLMIKIKCEVGSGEMGTKLKDNATNHMHFFPCIFYRSERLTGYAFKWE